MHLYKVLLTDFLANLKKEKKDKKILRKHLTKCFFYYIIVVGGFRDQKANICSPAAATPPGVSRVGAGAASRARPRNFFSKKKKKIPLLLYHETPGLVKRINKNFFVKFSQNPFVKS